MGKVLQQAAIAVVVLSLGASGVLGSLAGSPRGSRASAGKLKVGDEAPDVELVALDGSSRFRLRERLGNKPLVLIFGSYT